MEMKTIKETIKKLLGLLCFTLLLSSCASLGSKTLYSGLNSESKIKIEKILLIKPVLLNVNFYEESAADFYFKELQEQFDNYNIKVIKSNSTISDFDNIKPETEIQINEDSDCDYILIGRIKRLTVMGQTTDFRMDYKLIKSSDKKLVYSSKYSTTFGNTYVVVPGVGLPSEEKLMRDAIRLGLHNLKKDILNK